MPRLGILILLLDEVYRWVVEGALDLGRAKTQRRDWTEPLPNWASRMRAGLLPGALVRPERKSPLPCRARSPEDLFHLVSRIQSNWRHVSSAPVSRA